MMYQGWVPMVFGIVMGIYGVSTGVTKTWPGRIIAFLLTVMAGVLILHFGAVDV
jgi:hypothetical protein